jgi:hypothetical protein
MPRISIRGGKVGALGGWCSVHGGQVESRGRKCFCGVCAM